MQNVSRFSEASSLNATHRQMEIYRKLSDRAHAFMHMCTPLLPPSLPHAYSVAEEQKRAEKLSESSFFFCSPAIFNPCTGILEGGFQGERVSLEVLQPQEQGGLIGALSHSLCYQLVWSGRETVLEDVLFSILFQVFLGSISNSLLRFLAA